MLSNMFYDPKKPVLINEEGIFLANLDVPGRRTNWLFILTISLLGLMSIAFCLRNTGSTARSVFVPQMVCLILIVTIWFLKKVLSQKPYNILSPDVIFLSTFSVFHFAYIFFYSINVADWSEEVFWSAEKALPAISFSIWCLIFFLIGYELPGSGYSRKIYYGDISASPNAVNFVAKTLIFLAFFFFWGTLASVGLNRVFSDYKLMTSVASVSSWGRLYWLGHDLGVIGIALFCTASCLTKQKVMSGIVFVILSLGYMFSVLITGDRGGFLQLFVIPAVAFHYFQRRIRYYWIAGLFFLLFTTMAIIGATRDIVLGDVRKIAQEYQYVQEARQHNAITSTLIEFGSSIKTVNIAMELVPSMHSYWYGKSYLDSALVAIPNVIPGRVRAATGLGVWITETAFESMERTHGRGGSIAMEAYMNFGYAGAFIFLLVGSFCRSLYEKLLNRPTFFRLAMLLSTMAGLALWIRNTFSMFIRPPLWTFLIVGSIYLLTQNEVQFDNQALLDET